MTPASNGGGRNFAAAFAAVTQAARPLPTLSLPVIASNPVAEFIEACDSALAYCVPDAGELLPGIDVDQPEAMLKAFLLFLANQGLTSNSEDIDAQLVKDWHARVAPRVWLLLGFPRDPGLLSVQLAFSLLGQQQHVAGDARAFVWAVGDFAAIGLMPGLRS
jgi:hypothetical protein